MGWIMKARGELLALNCQKKDQGKTDCTLCNMVTVEEVNNFVFICTILMEHRRNWSGSDSLTTEQFLYSIQVDSNYKVNKYCEHALIEDPSAYSNNIFFASYLFYFYNAVFLFTSICT